MVPDITAWLPERDPRTGIAASAADATAWLEQLKHEAFVRAGLLGDSNAISDLLRRIRCLAESSVPVLVFGEIGSGKENAARALHLNSPRSARPFIAESCASLRNPLFMRQLFGHVRGAFTGASGNVGGLFDQADGGTLYLDEISETPIEAQACLLRVLETGEYRPLGSPQSRHSDFRLVASTSADLRAMVQSGLFRRDLYFRLRGAMITVPPLRTRRSDILPLAEQVIREEAQRARKAPQRLDESARHALLDYRWPGNVRELRQELRQAIALTESEELSAACFQFLRETPPERNEPSEARVRSRLRDRLGSMEATSIRDALRLAGGNKAEAARQLGLTRRTLYRRLDALRRFELPRFDSAEGSPDPRETLPAVAACAAEGDRSADCPSAAAVADASGPGHM